MYRAIRRVTVNSNLKATIIIVFPSQVGLVQCLMSLEICKQGTKQLAKALFNAEVEQVEQAIYIVLKEEVTLIVPNYKVTLKGVLDTAIIKVFSSKIHTTITEYCV